MNTITAKLQKALENKQLIVDSVNAKANTTFDINSKPSDIAMAISGIEGGSHTIIDNGDNTYSIILNGVKYLAIKDDGTVPTYTLDRSVLA